jgi:ribulose-5-phosphate 4-epimerase/fuculose-1-phosphate aldolase
LANTGIRNPRRQRLRRALATLSDGRDIALMHGHGSTSVGGSIREAGFRAVCAELNARYPLAASRLGEVTFLTEVENDLCATNMEYQVQRPWDPVCFKSGHDAGGVSIAFAMTVIAVSE